MPENIDDPYPQEPPRPHGSSNDFLAYHERRLRAMGHDPSTRHMDPRERMRRRHRPGDRQREDAAKEKQKAEELKRIQAMYAPLSPTSTGKQPSTRTEAENVVSDPGILSPIQSLYKMCVMYGVSPSDMIVNYEDSVSGRLPFAVPSIQFGISIGGQGDVGAFKKQGWIVADLAQTDVEPFHRVFEALSAITVAKYHARAEKNTKATSKCEDRLLSALLRAGIPAPDRNYTLHRVDGSELTTPDFTWEKEKIAFFVDGLYWHSVKHDNKIIKELKADSSLSADVIVNKNTAKLEKDARIRSELAIRGWTVLVCSDQDLDTSSGVMAQVENVARAFTMKHQAMTGHIGADDMDYLMEEFRVEDEGEADSGNDGEEASAKSDDEIVNNEVSIKDENKGGPVPSSLVDTMLAQLRNHISGN